MQGKMKAGIYYGPQNVGLEERDIPQIGPKDVLVKILRAGICGSDIGAYKHNGYRYGVFPNMPFGHEMVGKVVEKGAEVSEDIALDDIVFVEPSKAKRAGIIMTDMCGGFSEYVNVQDAKYDYNLYKLRKDVDLDELAIIEPVAVGTKAAVGKGVKETDNCVVLGAGTIGLAAAAALINRGVKNVVVVDRNDWKLNIAKEMGCKTINCKNEDMKTKLVELCGEAPKAEMNFAELPPELLKIFAEMSKSGATNVASANPNVDLYIDAAGAKELLVNAFAICREGSKYSIASVYDAPIELMGGLFITSQPEVYGSRGYEPETIKEVIDHIQNRKTCVRKIVTEKFKIDDFKTAMEHAADKQYKNIKVLIDYEMK